MTEISIDELKALLESGVKIVDVRERDEYTSGRIPGAINAPLSELAEHVELFRSDAAVYVVCLFGFIVWIGLAISWIFFHGAKPPLA